MVTGVETNFKIWMPCELTKAGDGKDEKWGFKGIASTTKRDTDGETLMPSGFDLTYFNESGLVNWNHLSKENPAAIIGEPTMAKIVPEGLYVETELYKTPTAKGVWELAKAMSKKKNSTKKLGFSIEGKVIERDPLDPTKILKAKITGLAITPTPKNNATFAEMIEKGITSENLEYLEDEDVSNFEKSISKDKKDIVSETMIEFANGKLKDSNGNVVTDKKQALAIAYSLQDESEKALTVDSGRAVIREDLEGAKKIQKSVVYEEIFQRFTTDLQKADKIYETIKNNNMDLNADTLEKALSQFDEIIKGNVNGNATPDTSTMAGSANGYDVEDVNGMFKCFSKSNPTAKKSDYMEKGKKEGIDEETCEKAYKVGIEKGFIKPDEKDDKKDDKATDAKDVDIKKAIADTLNPILEAQKTQNELLKAIGTELLGAKEENKALKERLERIEKQPNERRSVAATSFLEKGVMDEISKKAKSDNRIVLDIANKDDCKELNKAIDEKAFGDKEVNGRIEKSIINSPLANLSAEIEIAPIAVFSDRQKVSLIEKSLGVKIVDSSNEIPSLNF